jgi:hypothetical protein
VLLDGGDRALEFNARDRVGDGMLDVEVSGLKRSAITINFANRALARLRAWTAPGGESGPGMCR